MDKPRVENKAQRYWEKAELGNFEEGGGCGGPMVLPAAGYSPCQREMGGLVEVPIQKRKGSYSNGVHDRVATLKGNV